MKIGKGLPDGAVYTIPQANNEFAKKDDITTIENSLEQISSDVDLLSDDVDAINEKIPTPAAADAGKVLTANETGGYDLEESSSAGVQNLVDGSSNGSVRGINTPDSIGLNTIGQNSFQIGSDTTLASGDSSVAIGGLCRARSTGSCAIGSTNNAYSAYSAAIGLGLDTPSNTRGALVIGEYNSPFTGYLFTIGNGTGTSTSTRRNAFAINRLSSFIFGDNEFTITKQQFNELYTIVNNRPSSDGTYTLQVTVTDGTPTYSWVTV